MTQEALLNRLGMNNTPESFCHGKHPFETLRLAMQVANRGRRSDAVLQAYRCSACGHFHIGHPKKSRMLQRASRVRELEAEE